MDGLESNKGIVVMAATNRYEILDQALTRPGRFDRLVRINLPDEDGRLAILKVRRRANAMPCPASRPHDRAQQQCSANICDGPLAGPCLLKPTVTRGTRAQVHCRKLRLSDDVQLKLVAAAARQFSGAELAALCNEAAIRAARRESELISMQDFTSALVQYTTARRGNALGEGLLKGFMGQSGSN